MGYLIFERIACRVDIENSVSCLIDIVDKVVNECAKSLTRGKDVDDKL